MPDLPQSTSALQAFPPSRAKALKKLQSFAPHAASDYQTKRNYDLGAAKHMHVSQLSPYIRNGLLSEEEIVSAVLEFHSFNTAEKFLQEVFWRVYWKGYFENRSALWDQYRQDLANLQKSTSEQPLYHAALSATTGIECFDTWSRELVETGYLHNHARMWFASIWIHTLQIPWQLGADFFMRHLLDGDPASNTLSWRWVAGLHTKGKTYLARSSNIAQYTAERFPSSPGLATQAAPLSEPHPQIPPSFSELPPPPPFLSKNQGLVILDEDLRRHISSFEPGTPILGLYPETIYKAQKTAPHVSEFRKACLEATLDHLATEQGCVSSFSTNPNAAQILDWAKQNDLRTLFLAQPQVGPWRDLWQTLAVQLEAHDITLSYFRPWWENQLFPNATSGFFKFKKNIEASAQRMSASTRLKIHASP